MSSNSSVTIEERRLALEEYRVREEIRLRDRELDLKRHESGWISRLFTPLTTTILAGVLTVAGSAVATLMQSQGALNLEREKFAANRQLERDKQQHELIVKMVSVGDEKQARANLRFLAEARLVGDDLAKAVLGLKETPVLPSTAAPRTSSRAFQSVRSDDDALELILTWEQGYVPAQDGQPALNTGITLRALSDFLGRPVTEEEHRNLPRAVAKEFYRRALAPAAGIEDPMVRAAFLNLAVWVGPRRAMQTFQAAAERVQRTSIVGQDGILGPRSIAAINAVQDSVAFVETANCLLIESLKRNEATWSQFGARWLQRLRAFSPVVLQGVCPDLAAVPDASGTASR